MSDIQLIVPIAAQALVVYEADKVSKLNLLSRFPLNSILGKDHQYNLLDLLEGNQDYMDKGIHLHWKLPKILKHGMTDDKYDKEMVFPAVPNRWMVVRYQTHDIENAKDIPAKIWVVKSDSINTIGVKNWVALESIHEPNPNSPNDSTLEKQNFSFHSIGKSEPLLKPYNEIGEENRDITGVGAANPYFSAIYDECKDVFGFHDDMTDTHENDVFSYVITGWYSDPKNDPLDSNTTLHPDLVKKICKNWSFPETPETPVKTLFSHKLYHVVWNNHQRSGVPTGDINICLGQTTVEALSAYLNHKQKDKKEGLPIPKEVVEDYLNALLHHLMEEEQEEIGMEKIKLENHKREFVPKSRGILWEVKKIEQDNNPKKEKTTPFFPQDKTLVENLRTLNTQQVSFNDMSVQLANFRQAYYFNWYKMVLSVDDTNPDPDKIPQLRAKNEALKKDIETLSKEKTGLETTIKALVVQIGKNFNIKLPNTDNDTVYLYELVQINEDLYWQPADPSILLYGEGLGPVKDFFQDINETIRCRLSTQIIDKIHLKGSDIAYKSEAIFSLKSDLAAVIAHNIDIKKLIYETFILDPDLAVFTAIEADGTRRDKTSTIIQTLTDDIKRAQEELAQVCTYGLKIHKQAWEPLFMLWEVGFMPEGNPKEILCQGLSPMTHGTSNLLKEIASEGQYDPILSQNLSGFNKYLLAQQPWLQLPPLEYAINDGEFSTDFKLDQATLDIIGHQSEIYAVAPNPDQDGFSPIREGKLTLKKLSLVDGFGQQRIVVSGVVQKEIITSQSLGGAIKKTTEPMTLPKRIIQPMSVHLNWVNAQKEVLYQDTGKMDHPIIGWLVPNFLDNMVMIYDGQGHEVKALRFINNKDIIEEFYPSNEGDIKKADGQKEREDSLDPNFKALIHGLDIPKFMEDCKALHKRLSKSNDPVSSSAVSILYGKPIAIAQCKMSLAALGQSINPQWKPDNNIPTINNLELSFKVGDKEQKKDGLLGYFIGNDYKTLHESATSVIKLTPNQNSEEITVLLTAGAGFYVASEGILPAQYFQLFPHAVEELSREIRISFMLCPFMSDKNQSYIPTPNTPDAQWNWIHRSAVNVWAKPNEVNNSKPQESFDLSGQQFYEGWIKMDAVNYPYPEG